MPERVILIADDDDDDRLLVSEALAEAGIETAVRFVTDGEELLAYLRGTGAYRDGRDAPRPALLLLDLDMPRLDGRAALAEIRADPELSHIPVIVMTASTSDGDEARARALGVTGFLRKPATFARLVELVAELPGPWREIERSDDAEPG